MTTRPRSLLPVAEPCHRLLGEGQDVVAAGDLGDQDGELVAAESRNGQLGQCRGEPVGYLAEQAVKPTYCYASVYRGGAALGAHMDRRQCEYTLSLLVEQEPASREPWPLTWQCLSGS